MKHCLIKKNKDSYLEFTLSKLCRLSYTPTREKAISLCSFYKRDLSSHTSRNYILSIPLLFNN